MTTLPSQFLRDPIRGKLPAADQVVVTYHILARRTVSVVASAGMYLRMHPNNCLSNWSTNRKDTVAIHAPNNAIGRGCAPEEWVSG